MLLVKKVNKLVSKLDHKVCCTQYQAPLCLQQI